MQKISFGFRYLQFIKTFLTLRLCSSNLVQVFEGSVWVRMNPLHSFHHLVSLIKSIFFMNVSVQQTISLVEVCLRFSDTAICWYERHRQSTLDHLHVSLSSRTELCFPSSHLAQLAASPRAGGWTFPRWHFREPVTLRDWKTVDVGRIGRLFLEESDSFLQFVLFPLSEAVKGGHGHAKDSVKLFWWKVTLREDRSDHTNNNITSHHLKRSLKWTRKYFLFLNTQAKHMTYSCYTEQTVHNHSNENTPSGHTSYCKHIIKKMSHARGNTV